MSSAPTVGPYRLGERVGTSVWKAVDSRTEKPVALKILTKQLPKDAAKRDALVREVRVAAALYHAFVIPILEVAQVGDNLLLVMDFIDGDAIKKRLGGRPAERGDFFRIAYQMTDAVRFLHAKNLVHGNINADSVMVTSSGAVRLGGLNLLNLLPRPDGVSTHFQQKGNDLRSVAYMAPEQITGQKADQRTDVYSLGVVMYEMATGRLPQQGATAGDVARAIVEGNPTSPKSINPAIDPVILRILGRCLFKDQFSRPKDAKAVLDDLGKGDPEATRISMEMTSRGSTQTQIAAVADETSARQAILLIADVANYAELAATDPEGAAKAVARMQQVLGEAVYLFDGHIVDPFSKRLVAELPSVESALEAGRKGEFDFSPDQQSAPVIPVRLLLHAGNVVTRDGEVTGETISRAASALEHIPPMQLHLTEEFVRRAKGTRVRDAGARGGVKLFTIPPAEKPKPAPPPLTDEEEEEMLAEEEILQAETVVAPAGRKRPTMLVAAALAVLVSLGALGAYLFSRSRGEEAARPSAASSATDAPARAPQKVFITPLAIAGEQPDPALMEFAAGIRAAVIEILRSVPAIQVSETAGADVAEVVGTIRRGEAGPEFAPEGVEAPTPLPDAATGIRVMLDRVSLRARTPIRTTASVEALNAFATALTASAANDPATAEPAIRAAIAADPDFLAAQMLARSYFLTHGLAADALAAAQRVAALDPGNLDALRDVARTSLSLGAVGPAFQAYGSILEKNPADIEGLTQVARYAASVNDAPRFTAALTRLNALPVQMRSVHAPDILVANGQMGSAIDQYYDIEVDAASNPSLALKIGRISVLRRAQPIAQLELEKLEKLDPGYGYHLLKAFMAASANARDEAEQELDIAAASMSPGDDFWTSAAEVYAMIGANDEVIDSLQKAAARKEPTAAYILTNPLFAYLRSDARFQAIRSQLNAQQAEVRAALAQVPVR